LLAIKRCFQHAEVVNLAAITASSRMQSRYRPRLMAGLRREARLLAPRASTDDSGRKQVATRDTIETGKRDYHRDRAESARCSLLICNFRRRCNLVPKRYGVGGTRPKRSGALSRAFKRSTQLGKALRSSCFIHAGPGNRSSPSDPSKIKTEAARRRHEGAARTY